MDRGFSEVARERIDKLCRELELFRKQSELLSKENQELKEQIIRLEDKLNINSRNSGLQTSREIYGIEESKRARSERKGGGQPGHKLNAYEMRAADKVV